MGLRISDIEDDIFIEQYLGLIEDVLDKLESMKCQFNLSSKSSDLFNSLKNDLECINTNLIQIYTIWFSDIFDNWLKDAIIYAYNDYPLIDKLGIKEIVTLETFFKDLNRLLLGIIEYFENDEFITNFDNNWKKIRSLFKICKEKFTEFFLDYTLDSNYKKIIIKLRYNSRIIVKSEDEKYTLFTFDLRNLVIDDKFLEDIFSNFLNELHGKLFLTELIEIYKASLNSLDLRIIKKSEMYLPILEKYFKKKYGKLKDKTEKSLLQNQSPSIDFANDKNKENFFNQLIKLYNNIKKYEKPYDRIRLKESEVHYFFELLVTKRFIFNVNDSIINKTQLYHIMYLLTGFSQKQFKKQDISKSEKRELKLKMTEMIDSI